MLNLGMSQTPPCNPWGINFGGGLNSTAVILACIERGHRPDWILFADTGSEYPGTLEHVERIRQLVAFERPDWPEVVTVRWERLRPVKYREAVPASEVPFSDPAVIGSHEDLGTGEVHHIVEREKFIAFEPLHDNCLRTGHLPSKAYGLAGCTMKWKVQPMDKWRKAHGYQQGAFAVGYDAGEARRITSACKRGDTPGFTAWYPLVAWGIDRAGCQEIVDRWGVKVGKSSCFMCPNMKRQEWLSLKAEHPDLFDLSVEIEDNAAAHGNFGRGGGGLYKGTLRGLAENHEAQTDLFTEDRCHHGGCFT